MTAKFTNEHDLVANKELREVSIDRVEVLDKVKSLLLIAELEVATTTMVADFYEVDKKVIDSMTLRHRDELDTDGLYLLTKKQALNLRKTDLMKSKYSVELGLGDGSFAKVVNRGTLAFPRRAILRIGMLLQDSKIAEEIRTQILNIEEQASNEVKVQAIDEEQSLLMEITKAMMNGDAIATSMATANLVAFKNRHIAQLDTKVAVLTQDLMTQSPRQIARQLVGAYAGTTGKSFADVWTIVYRELLYKHGINVKTRRTKAEGVDSKKPLIEFLDTQEQYIVLATLVAMCEIQKHDVSEILMKFVGELPEVPTPSVKKAQTWDERQEEYYEKVERYHEKKEYKELEAARKADEEELALEERRANFI